MEYEEKKKIYKYSPEKESIVKECLLVKVNSLFGEFSFLGSFQTETLKWHVRQ